MKIYKLLKQLRTTKGMTQEAIAKEIGITRSAYANYEQGTREPNLEQLIKLCRILETTPNELLGWED